MLRGGITNPSALFCVPGAGELDFFLDGVLGGERGAKVGGAKMLGAAARGFDRQSDRCTVQLKHVLCLKTALEATERR